MDKEKGLETLLAWQKAMAFAVTLCKQVIPALPKEERYSLADQLRRAAQSVPANIAEGHGRYYFQDGIRFCYIARGSLEEVYSHLFFANQMGYLTDEAFRGYSTNIQELHRIINGYITFLKRTKQGEGEPGHSQHESPGLYHSDESDLIDNPSSGSSPID
jgi:four helix bundle protein